MRLPKFKLFSLILVAEITLNSTYIINKLNFLQYSAKRLQSNARVCVCVMSVDNYKFKIMATRCARYCPCVGQYNLKLYCPTHGCSFMTRVVGPCQRQLGVHTCHNQRCSSSDSDKLWNFYLNWFSFYSYHYCIWTLMAYQTKYSVCVCVCYVCRQL